jgi:AcrR family transcriptional regulator
MTPNAAGSPQRDPRRRVLLEAALSVFTRYGYQKTSMEEVARAAQVSRQGLYLHFSTKEELFQAALESALEDSSSAALAALNDAKLPLEKRLVRTFDEWIGRYVGMMGGSTSDLIEATVRLSGAMLTQYEESFAESVTKAIRSSRLPAAHRSSGASARQLTEILLATARGLKHGSKSREEFVQSFTVAVKVVCAPLRKTS